MEVIGNMHERMRHVICAERFKMAAEGSKRLRAIKENMLSWSLDKK